jgi:hypothetical protein
MIPHNKSPFVLCPYTHPTKPPQMAFAIIFVENTDDMLILRGEKERAPDVSSLIGGKVSDGERKNQLNEIDNPFIALQYEILEETGSTFKLQRLSYELKFILPHKGIAHDIHLYSGRIPKEDLQQLTPQFGTIETVNIKTIKDAVLDNEAYLSPMNNRLVQLYKENTQKKNKPESPLYKDYTPFISLDEFQSLIDKKKARLGQHPA